MSFFERSLLSQRGRRFLKSCRGSRSARPAFSRNLAPKKALFSRVRRKSRSRFSGVTSEKIASDETRVGEHEQEAIVVVDDLETVTVSLLPCRLQGQAEGPVDPAAPERVEYHLLRVGGVEGVLKMLDEQMAAVGQVERLSLPSAA